MSIRAPSSGLAAGSAVCKVKKGRLFGQLPSAFFSKYLRNLSPDCHFPAFSVRQIPASLRRHHQDAVCLRPQVRHITRFSVLPVRRFRRNFAPEILPAPPPRNSAAAAPHRKKKRKRAAPLPYGTTAAPSVSPFFCAPVARAALRPPSLRPSFSLLPQPIAYALHHPPSLPPPGPSARHREPRPCLRARHARHHAPPESGSTALRLRRDVPAGRRGGESGRKSLPKPQEGVEALRRLPFAPGGSVVGVRRALFFQDEAVVGVRRPLFFQDEAVVGVRRLGGFSKQFQEGMREVEKHSDMVFVLSFL